MNMPRRSVVCVLVAAVFLTTGCDAFVRKFTRKSKRDKKEDVQMVLVPEEYKGPDLTKEELYRSDLLFWKSWHTELIEALMVNANKKKQAGCSDEAIKRLEKMRARLNETAQKRLNTFLTQLRDLREEIDKDTYSAGRTNQRQSAERLKRQILRDFSYAKVKDSLV